MIQVPVAQVYNRASHQCVECPGLNPYPSISLLAWNKWILKSSSHLSLLSMKPGGTIWPLGMAQWESPNFRLHLYLGIILKYTDLQFPYLSDNSKYYQFTSKMGINTLGQIIIKLENNVIQFSQIVLWSCYYLWIMKRYFWLSIGDANNNFYDTNTTSTLSTNKTKS